MRKSFLLGVVLATMAASGANAELVAYYPLDGDSNDHSVNGNNNAIAHNTTPASNCLDEANHAYDFNGTNSYLRAAGSSSLEPAKVTVACWVCLRETIDVPGVDNFVCKRVGNRLNSFNLEVGAKPDSSWYQCAMWQLNGGQGDDTVIHAPNPMSMNAWHHVAGTYDGSVMMLYVDGLEVASTPYTTPIGYDPVGELVMGGIYDGTLQLVDGRLDEIRIYSTALSAGEIAVLASDCSPPVPIQELSWGKIKGHYR